MIIFTKDKSCIINSEFIMKACICNGNSIKADLTNNRMEMLAKYQNTKQCEIALDMLAHAMRKGDDVFEMPYESELDFGSQHSSKVTSMKRSHGGT